jgi:hypothetical protein
VRWGARISSRRKRGRIWGFLRGQEREVGEREEREMGSRSQREKGSVGEQGREKGEKQIKILGVL